ncbi:uncharacterized protein LOC106471575 isoform X2 [Limulus polyphemus]|uniref:Uncharacterized protein LOC106471575 isoform X2 n=1 Tax=Limulus polyphemus TaxID=6850 RepID=A0ABM1TJ41_LIMPO|nr:uncharacterized protein LOC106471575 isoform X2 [Limulus polyphemus]
MTKSKVSDSGSEHGDCEEVRAESTPVKDSLDDDSTQVNAETTKEEKKPVRRASRKAALLAAEKIQRTVREYGLLEGVRSETPEPELRRDSSISAKLNLSKELKAELLKKKAPNLAPTTSPCKNITVSNQIGYSYTNQNALYMECFEEVLSPVQAAAYRQAQQEYDKVMKYILSRRSCKNEKVRIIYTSHEGEVLNTVGPIEDSNSRIQASLSGTRKNFENNIISKPLTVEGRPVQLTSNLEQSAVTRAVVLTGKSGTVVQNHKILQTTKPSSVQTTSGENSVPELLVDTSTGTAMKSVMKDTTKLQSMTVQNKTTGEIPKNLTLKQHNESGKIGKSPHLHTTLIQGSSKTVSAHSLMDIKPKPLTQVSSEEIEESIDKLKKKLLEEKCFQEPAFWLVTMKMLPENPLCLVCTKSTSDLVPDSTSIDGYVWKCGYERCGKKSQIIRPNFFGRFGIPLSKLLQLTYHWSVQSDLNDTLGEVNVDVYMARSVWRALQEVCARALVLKSKKLGGPGTMVEVSFAYMGRFSILGAYDRESGKVRMKAISSSMGWSASVYIRSLEPWLLPNSVIVSSEERMKEITRSGHTFILAHAGASEEEEEEHNVNKVKNYLYVQLSAMFGQFIVAQLKLETVQGYLDEIQWRERFGTNPYDTFSNIITDIGEQSGRKISTVGPQKQNQLPENVITMIGEKNDLKYQREYKGQVKRPAENTIQKTTTTPPKNQSLMKLYMSFFLNITMQRKKEIVKK